jgi:D-glycero-D-manno-heptose 1,7-bisphosphate phosphatase
MYHEPVSIDAINGPAAFLDRDGVLNQAVVRHGRPYPPASVEEMEILPGVHEALDRLKAAGYRLVVVTNQPDVARGLQRREAVEAINAALMARLPLDEFRVCYHNDADGCTCRKPQPGLLVQQPAYNLARSVMIGDRWRDIEAGRRAGVRATVLIDYGYEERQVEPDVRVPSLGLAVDWILKLPPNGP